MNIVVLRETDGSTKGAMTMAKTAEKSPPPGFTRPSHKPPPPPQKKREVLLFLPCPTTGHKVSHC